MEKIGEVDQEKTNATKQYWDSFSSLYEEMVENFTIQSSFNLYSLTNAKDSSKI